MRDILDFDLMVKAARRLLLDRGAVDGHPLNSLNCPLVDRLPRDNMLEIEILAEYRFETYRNGGACSVRRSSKTLSVWSKQRKRKSLFSGVSWECSIERA